MGVNIHYWKLNAYIGLLAPRRRLHSRMTLTFLHSLLKKVKRNEYTDVKVACRRQAMQYSCYKVITPSL